MNNGRSPAELVEELRSRNGHLPETMTAAELMALEFPPMREAVPGILPEGVSILGGKPKMGKSWMALGLCVAVASGGVALGTKKVERGGALYLSLEDNPRRLQKRLKKVLQGEDAPARLHVRTDWPRMGEGGVELLSEWLEGHPDTRLVVIDTHARFKPAPGSGRRSQYDEDRASVDPLAPLVEEHRVALVLVHHLREADSDDPLDMISGGSGLTGGVDNALVLKRQRGRADAYLVVDGRDIEEPVELALEWDANVASWCIAGDADAYRLTKERAEIVGVLESHGEPMTPSEVADALGKKFNAVKQRLWHMSKDGQVAAADGRYSPIDPITAVTNHNQEERGKGGL